MEESCAAGNVDLDHVRKEFSDRINATEKKLQTISRVRNYSTTKHSLLSVMCLLGQRPVETKTSRCGERAAKQVC